MPQNNQSITESPEFKEFCKKNNLEVFNQETINVVLFKQQEIINEIAKNTLTFTINWNNKSIDLPTLFDKWNKNGK